MSLARTKSEVYPELRRTVQLTKCWLLIHEDLHATPVQHESQVQQQRQESDHNTASKASLKIQEANTLPLSTL